MTRVRDEKIMTKVNRVTVRWESHGFSCRSNEPPEKARKPQLYPVFFTFPSRIACYSIEQWGPLNNICFSRPWQSHALLYKQFQYWTIHPLTKPVILYKNIFAVHPHPNHIIDYVRKFRDFKSWPSNWNTGSGEMVILLNMLILPYGGVTLGMFCTCSLCNRLVYQEIKKIIQINYSWSSRASE